ncbi:MAG: helix-turn-helix transcriptional regulator [Heliobacteriaceae bacterium]|jgi:transcriptional regulator with XRE-family HTH domain|nr:helix-turn-helix transcriptional regulator [Heliobacteriaceae bacterium]
MERNKIIKLFASNLRAERARNNYTQEYLAEKADITQEYLARLEGEKYSPSLVVIVNLAIALNVNVDKLIPLDEFLC